MNEENQTPVQPRFWMGEGSKDTAFVNDRRSTEPVCMVFVKHHPGMAEVICRCLNEAWGKFKKEEGLGESGTGDD